MIVVDEQCVRADLLDEAQKINAPLIATSSMNCSGLPDRTDDEPEEIIADLVSGKTPGILILDPEKVGEVAVRTAMAVMNTRKKIRAIPTPEELIELAKQCGGCQECSRVCPAGLPLAIVMQQAGQGDPSALASLYDTCIGCGKCEDACLKEIPVHSAILSAADSQIQGERFNVRAGRGAIQDIEIREVGGPIVLGEIPVSSRL